MSSQPSTPSNATTDASTSATSEATATVCQECTAEDHVFVCHVPHQPNSDFAVSALSRPTGATAVTEASRLVLKNKSSEVSSHTNTTLTKSTRNSKVTTENSSWLTPNGTDKSMNGAVKLWSVSNKSFCASTQDTTNNQPKLKSTNSMISSENKPRSGSVSKKTSSTVKSNASTKNGRPHQTMEIVSEQQLYSVKAKWEACMVSRKGKVSIFTRCLYGKRDHTRACLEQRLKERA